MISWPFWRNISNRISCSRAFKRRAAIDELRRSSGGGVDTDGLDNECCVWLDAWDVCWLVGPDWVESVGEIGGDTAEPEALRNSVDWWFSIFGRWAAEMLANNVWNDALALGEYKLPTLGCIIGGGGALWNWLK